MRFVSSLFLLTGLALFTSTSSAAISQLHKFCLGEEGSIIGGLPQDDVGSSHFGTIFGAVETGVSSSGVVAPGSSAFATFDGSQGAYGCDFSALPTDNFAMEVWVRTSNLEQANSVFFVTHNAVAGAKFHYHNGNWAASYHNVAWVGADDGVGQTITAGKWTHLALIRHSGVSTFYIDGIAQAGTPTGVPVHSTQGHIAVSPGGASAFEGHLDELRIFGFDPVSDDPVAALNLPNDSVLEITGFEHAGNMIALSWASVEGVKYSVSASIDQVNWDNNLEDSITGVPGSETSRSFDLSDFLLENEERVFFRVDLAPNQD